MRTREVGKKERGAVWVWNRRGDGGLVLMKRGDGDLVWKGGSRKGKRGRGKREEGVLVLKARGGGDLIQKKRGEGGRKRNGMVRWGGEKKRSRTL